ncbi:MAG TPA: DUF4430 domain-containing protein [Solirubrobacterales bacterium]|nr:DUF4430 domain-containing protein [Solirubrobacterales bacterium]
MLRRRGTAVASALPLLAAALAAAGCGLGAGAGVGRVSLRVTRDFGAAPVSAPVRDDASESDTVMRVLDRNAEIETSYGGRYVRAIGGLGEATRGGRRYDWFFFVNGVEASVGAADFPLRGGEAIWWDYRDWSSALYVPAVVGSWPEPLLDGYEGRRHPVAVECLGGGRACGEVRARLAAAGVEVAAGAPDEAIRVLVGPWARLRSDPAAAQLERGPQLSGVYGKFATARRSGASFVPSGYETRTGSAEMVGLDAGGAPERRFGPDAGLVAATRRYGAPPVWVVTGATARGVRAAAGLLDAAHLRDRYAVATEGGRDIPLPVQATRTEPTRSGAG